MNDPDTDLLIGGRWRAGDSGESAAVRMPDTGEVIGRVAKDGIEGLREMMCMRFASVRSVAA